MPPRAGLTVANRMPGMGIINPLAFSPTLGSANASNATLTTGADFVEFGYTATTAGSGYAAVIISSATPWDFSRSALFGLELGEVSPGGQPFQTDVPANRLRIFLGTTQGALGSDYYDFNTQLQNVSKRGRFTWAQRLSAGSVVGSPSWSNIRRIEIRMVSDTYPSGHRLRLYNVFSNFRARPKIVISFDDNSADVFNTAYSLMQPLGIPGTNYINSNSVGDSGKMTRAQLQTTYDAGWDIGNHTADHISATFPMGAQITQTGGLATATPDANVWLPTFAPGDVVQIDGADPFQYCGQKVITNVGAGTVQFACDPSLPSSIGQQTLTPLIVGGATSNWYDRWQASVQRCQDFIVSNGWTRGAGHMAYTYGNYNNDVIARLKAMGFVSGRATGGRGHGPFTNCLTMASPNMDFFNTPVFGWGPGTTGAQILTAVDRAIEYGASIHVYGHNIGTGGDITVPEFTNFINGLAARMRAGLIDAMSVSDWYQSCSSQVGYRA